jgi:hypothetical protein
MFDHVPLGKVLNGNSSGGGHQKAKSGKLKAGKAENLKPNAGTQFQGFVLWDF